MRVFIDTNVLISSALFPDSKPAMAVYFATSKPNIGLICEQNINEMIKTFHKKFPHRFSSLESFLSKTIFSFEFVSIPSDVNASEKRIRDIKDRPLLRAAIKAEADLFLTGDKDFLESGIKNPKIISVSDFLKLFN